MTERLEWDRARRFGPFELGRRVPMETMERYQFRFREITNWRDRPTTRFESPALDLEVDLAGGVLGALGCESSFYVDGLEIIGAPLDIVEVHFGPWAGGDDFRDEGTSYDEPYVSATREWQFGTVRLWVYANSGDEGVDVLRVTIAGIRDQDVIPDETEEEKARSLAEVIRRTSDY